MLAQLALRLTVPGVPDTYQGTELADLSLVDPDNRRPVDYDARATALLDGSSAKMALMAELLALRRAHPALFAQGDYRALTVTGARADDIVAFERSFEGETLRVVIGLRGAGDWGDTGVEGECVADLLGERPVAVRIL